MTISDDNRRTFEMLGGDAIAHALATGTLQSLGLTEDKKREAIEWLEELKTNRETERKHETTRANSIFWWTVVAAVASVIAAAASVAGLFRQ
jgi:hypothetical protein